MSAEELSRIGQLFSERSEFEGAEGRSARSRTEDLSKIVVLLRRGAPEKNDKKMKSPDASRRAGVHRSVDGVIGDRPAKPIVTLGSPGETDRHFGIVRRTETPDQSTDPRFGIAWRTETPDRFGEGRRLSALGIARLRRSPLSPFEVRSSPVLAEISQCCRQQSALMAERRALMACLVPAAPG